MANFFKQAVKSPFFTPLKTDKSSVILWVSVLILLTVKIYEGDFKFFAVHFGEHYQDTQILNWAKWAWHHGASLLLFFAVPLVLIKTGLKQDLKAYGLQLGDWKFGLKATLIAFVVMPLLVYNSSLNEVHKLFYQSEFPLQLATSSGLLFLAWVFTYLPHYIGWEFFFRGYIGFGFKFKYGAFAAIMLQTILTVLMHIGKPEGETWGAAVGGIYLGLLTYRTKSVYYAIIFHWYLGILNSWFCSM